MLEVRIDAPGLADLTIVPRLPDEVSIAEISREFGRADYAVEIPASISLTENYPAAFDPLGETVRPASASPARSTDASSGSIWTRKSRSRSSPRNPCLSIRRLRSSGSGRRRRAFLFDPSARTRRAGRRRRDGLCGDKRASGSLSRRRGLSPVLPRSFRWWMAGLQALFGRSPILIFGSAPSLRQRISGSSLSMSLCLPVHASDMWEAEATMSALHMRRLGLDVTDLGEADLTTGSLADFTPSSSASSRLASDATSRLRPTGCIGSWRRAAIW